MAVSSFPVLSSLSANVNISSDVTLFSLNLPLVNIFSRPSTHPSSSIIVCSYISESGNDAVTERRKKLLEQYGLNPDEFLSEPSTNFDQYVGYLRCLEEVLEE